MNWQNDFDFIPDVPTFRNDLKTSITYRAKLIKETALKALQDAYGQWKVQVVEGTPGTGDHEAIVQTLSTSSDCGQTDPNQTISSNVFYECNMEQAQVALRAVINNAQDEDTALNRDDLIQAIGNGIGNNAAHELAHQFLVKCCGMDARFSTDSAAAGTYNMGEANADPDPAVIDSDPAPYTGVAKDGHTLIHWESNTEKALSSCLGAGWTNYGLTACAVNLHLSQNLNGPILFLADRFTTPLSSLRYLRTPLARRLASRGF